VANLAAFPFTVRGEMDDDPIRQIERAAFAPILRQWLAQAVGLSPDPEPLVGDPLIPRRIGEERQACAGGSSRSPVKIWATGAAMA
jgi:hypothetical protein